MLNLIVSHKLSTEKSYTLQLWTFGTCEKC